MDTLPNITKVTWKDKKIFLHGTAHVSKESVREVAEYFSKIEPDTVCVELCDSRLESIRNRDNWKNMDIFKVIRQKKTVFLLAQLLMSSFYRKLGKQLEVTPGAEMIEGVRMAEENNKTLITADRNIEITLRRIWGGLSFWQKLKLASSLIPSLLFGDSEEIDDETVEDLKKTDNLEHAMAEFAHEYPGIRQTLIYERDMYIAEKIKAAPGSRIMAVVGAAHVQGIMQRLNEEHNLQDLEQIPPKSIIPKLIGWAIPLLVIAIIATGFLRGGTERGYDMIILWVLLNGTLSALGALAAFAHPVTIISAFIAAPLTSLNPTVGAGYVTGIVQTWFKRPTVADLEAVPEATESAAGFWKNPMTRILLVVILSSLGSSIASFSYPFIAAFMQ
ncbi:MAG: TraB/GumN family protein [Fibrobacterota bacterium]